MKRSIFFALSIMILVMVLACGTSGPTAFGLLRDAASKIAEAETIAFSIDRVGESYGWDLGGETADITSTTGEYEAPDKVQLIIDLDIGGESLTMDLVMIDEDSYLKMPPLFDEYEPFDMEEELSASMLFAKDGGVPTILKSTLKSTSLAEEEETVDGITCYHITATGDADNIAGVIGFGGAEAGDGTVDVWIAKDTGALYRITVKDQKGNGWTMTLSAYNQGVDIPAL